MTARVLVILTLFSSSFAVSRKRPDPGPPLLLVVGIDGLRYDFVTESYMPNLHKLAVDGAWAKQGMVPAFPTETTNNFVTLSTGLYTENHGISGNIMVNSATGEPIYNYWGFHNGSDLKEPSKDSHWYHGTPFWQVNEDAASTRRSGSMYWPTGDAMYNGKVPSKVWSPYSYKEGDGLEMWRRDLDTLVSWFEDPDEPINLGAFFISFLVILVLFF